MWITCIDGHYDTSRCTVADLGSLPPGVETEKIAITVAEARAVYEGCWLDRALSFHRHAINHEILSPRQRALVRDAPAYGRTLRRVGSRVLPEVQAALRETWAGRCIPRRVLWAAAGGRTASDQLLRAARATVRDK